MWMETKAKAEEETSRNRASVALCVLNGLSLCTGDMKHIDEYMRGKKTPHCYIQKLLLISNFEVTYEMCHIL